MMNRRVFISLAAKMLAMTKKMFRMNNLKKIMGFKASMKAMINCSSNSSSVRWNKKR